MNCTREDATEDVLKARDDLLTDCERSKRYHSARLRFYETTNRWFIFAMVASSAGAIVQWGSASVPWLPAVTAALGLFSLVFDLSGKARLHDSLYRRCANLNGRIESSADSKQSDISEWRIAIHGIYGDEPPVYRILNQHCANQVLQSLYEDIEENAAIYRKYYVPLNWYHRLLKNFLPFSNFRVTPFAKEDKAF